MWNGMKKAVTFSYDNGVTMLINEHVMNVLDEGNGLLSNSVKSIVCDSNNKRERRNGHGITPI